MSFSSAPDAALLGRVAGALVVDEAFVEKDWYVVQAITVLVGVGTADIQPVFSGGTSLLKGHRLIKRFSEDIDFKLALSPAFLALGGNPRRRALGDFRDTLVAAWKAAGFDILSVVSASGNSFLRIEMAYPTVLAGHPSLRPHILAELSAKPPHLAPIERPLASFVGQYGGALPEVATIACVDPVETGADKLSAFTWRMILRDRDDPKDDATIVRHIHDLAALEGALVASCDFPALLHATMVADTDRGGGGVAHLSPDARLAEMMARIDGDPLYAGEYERFVGGMAFAGDSEIPAFGVGVEALRRLSLLLPPDARL